MGLLWGLKRVGSLFPLVHTCITSQGGSDFSPVLEVGWAQRDGSCSGSCMWFSQVVAMAGSPGNLAQSQAWRSMLIVSRDLCWPCWQEHLHVTSPCALGFFTSWWVLRRVSPDRHVKAVSPLRPSFRSLFCHILSVEAVTKVQSGSRSRNRDHH